MKVAIIRIADTKEINIEAGGLSPAQIVQSLDAVINVLCQQATGDPVKGQAMKAHLAQQNMIDNTKIILP